MEKMIPITFFKNIRNPKDFVPLVYEDILPGYYLINTLGEIYSLKRGKIMNQDTNKGYKRICLITSNGKRNFSVHRWLHILLWIIQIMITLLMLII